MCLLVKLLSGSRSLWVGKGCGAVLGGWVGRGAVLCWGDIARGPAAGADGSPGLRAGRGGLCPVGVGPAEEVPCLRQSV